MSAAEMNGNIFTTIPPQISHGKPGQLTEAQLKQFFDEGFMIVEDFFDKTLLDLVKKDIELMVDRLAHQLYEAGKVKSLYEDVGFYQRLSKLEADFPGANIILHKTGKLPSSFRHLWSDERLLNVAEQVLGTADIVGNPVWNLRCKTPNNEATIVPWHQDTAYMDYDDCKKMVFSSWIPLLDTNETNGGMEMLRGGHRANRIGKHTCCYGGTWYVMLDEAEMMENFERDPAVDGVKCTVPYGSTVFFNNMIPHRSLSNTSNDIRWALDLRFNRKDVSPGFWGLKDGVQLRSSTDPKFPIDWESFESVDRTSKQFEALEQEQTEFDTTISGPWMKRWEIVYHNRHSDALTASDPKAIPSIIG